MEKPCLKAKIVKIKPGAGYEGKIYDQDVILELPGGIRFDVFDSFMRVKETVVGETKLVEISIGLANVTKETNPHFEVIPDVSLNRKSTWGHVFFGKVRDIDEKFKMILVDIGAGTIKASIDRNLKGEIQIGGFVKVFSVRADINGIHDDVL